MQGAIHRDLTVAADALSEALHRVRFLVIAAELRDVETLAPEKFLSEVMDNIGLAAKGIQRVSQRYVCGSSPEAQT